MWETKWMLNRQDAENVGHVSFVRMLAFLLTKIQNHICESAQKADTTMWMTVRAIAVTMSGTVKHRKIKHRLTDHRIHHRRRLLRPPPPAVTAVGG